MPTSARLLLSCVMLTFVLTETGCNMVDRRTYRQSNYRAHRLYRLHKRAVRKGEHLVYQNQMLAGQQAHLQQQNAMLSSSLQSKDQELAAAQTSLADAQSSLDVANQRIANLQGEREEIQSRYISMLKVTPGPSPLPDGTTRRFEELANKYPNFDFDPETGVSKFHSDVLFPSGSAVLSQQADPLLRDFAEIMNDAEANGLKILVVGHTDNQQIRPGPTKEKHPTNWHLSTNRANAVVAQLQKLGIQPERMGAAGYSLYQPVANNIDESGRSRNRRVEIFVLAPDAAVAGWEEGGPVQE